MLLASPWADFRRRQTVIGSGYIGHGWETHPQSRPVSSSSKASRPTQHWPYRYGRQLRRSQARRNYRRSIGRMAEARLSSSTVIALHAR